MRNIKQLSRRTLTWAAAGLSAAAVTGAVAVSTGVTAASATTTHRASFTFALVPPPNIAACLPNAGGSVTITPGKLNDLMKVSIHGMPHGVGFDLFVIQQPTAPFG